MVSVATGALIITGSPGGNRGLLLYSSSYTQGASWQEDENKTSLKEQGVNVFEPRCPRPGREKSPLHLDGDTGPSTRPVLTSLPSGHWAKKSPDLFLGSSWLFPHGDLCPGSHTG